MDMESAVREFNAVWETAVGPTSDFERELTPQSRKFSKFLVSDPVWVVDTLLRGVSATGGVVATPAVTLDEGTGVRPLPGVVWLVPAFGATAVGVVCACVQANGYLTAGLVAGVTAVLSWAVRACVRRRVPRSRPPASAVAQVRPGIAIDPGALRHVAEIFRKQLDNVTAYVKNDEKDRALSFDVTDSNAFGEWVQMFVDFANRSPDDLDLRLLKEALISKLRMMGITVYDRILKDKTGRILLPEADTYRDERTDETYEFSVVRHAVVTSRRKVLAIGELA